MPKKTKTSDPAPIAWGGPEHMARIETTYSGIQLSPAPMTGSTEAADLANGNTAQLMAESFWDSAQNCATRTYSIDSLSTVLDAATQAILTQRADVMPQAVKVAQAALERLLEALQVDPKAKEGAK